MFVPAIQCGPNGCCLSVSSVAHADRLPPPSRDGSLLAKGAFLCCAPRQPPGAHPQMRGDGRDLLLPECGLKGWQLRPRPFSGALPRPAAPAHSASAASPHQPWARHAILEKISTLVGASRSRACWAKPSAAGLPGPGIHRIDCGQQPSVPLPRPGRPSFLGGFASSTRRPCPQLAAAKFSISGRTHSARLALHKSANYSLVPVSQSCKVPSPWVSAHPRPDSRPNSVLFLCANVLATLCIAPSKGREEVIGSNCSPQSLSSRRTTDCPSQSFWPSRASTLEQQQGQH